jgi:c(7)-type cytochrome triheme protein
MKTTLVAVAGRLSLGVLLLVGNATPGHAQLDFELDVLYIPPSTPFFKVQFSHAQHKRWNDCSDCHPGASSQRAGMLAIFEGESCGSCHGNTAFVVETDCWRCHDNLVRPRKAVAEADLARAREAPVPGSPEIREHGEKLFQGLCSGCHGNSGDGNGPFAAFLNPPPRDFSGQAFKQRIDASDTLSVDIDLYRTLSLGIKGTAMPAWSALPPRDRWALIHYVKTFASGGV